MYDAAIARFTGVDPISDQFAWVSTYNYAENSPIRFIDLWGLQKADPPQFFENRNNSVEQSNPFISINRVNNRIIDVQSSNGLGSPNPKTTIKLRNNVRESDVSDQSAIVINGIASESGEGEVSISSGARTAEDQARIMFNKSEREGVESMKDLYGSNGDQVIDVYNEERNNAGSCDLCTKDAMVNKINDLGANNVSNHAADPDILQTFDISPSSVQNKKGFRKAINNATGPSKPISRRFHPGGSERAFHIEIPQKN